MRDQSDDPSVSLDAVTENDVCKEPTMNMISRFVKDESGATAIEYGLIAALIAVGIIGAATALGGSLSGLFESISGQLDTAVAGAAAGDGGGDDGADG
jgi:pilus assembly protein Flp/PilA